LTYKTCADARLIIISTSCWRDNFRKILITFQRLPLGDLFLGQTDTQIHRYTDDWESSDPG